jgi:hypothetical protein
MLIFAETKETIQGLHAMDILKYYKPRTTKFMTVPPEYVILTHSWS